MSKWASPQVTGGKMSRATKLVLIGGLASGAAFAAVTGISSATTGTAKATTNPSPSTPAAGWHRRGGMGAGAGFGAGPGGFGSEGTVTGIDGSTLTLRTESGTETVTTSSTTGVTKEMRSVTLAAIKVGDVIHVLPVRSAAPAPSGSTTLAASRIEIVEPTLTGRVTAVGSGTLSLVGPDGGLLSVSTTPATEYYNGRTKADSSAVTVGSYVVAEGARDTLTHLDADVVSVVTKPTGFSGGGSFPHGPGQSPNGPGPWSAEGPASA